MAEVEINQRVLRSRSFTGFDLHPSHQCRSNDEAHCGLEAGLEEQRNVAHVQIVWALFGTAAMHAVELDQYDLIRKACSAHL